MRVAKIDLVGWARWVRTTRWLWVALLGTFLIGLITGLAVQHVMHRGLDWRSVSYHYGPEVKRDPPSRTDIGKLIQRDNAIVVALRPYGNGADMRRAVVQYVAFHEGAVVRYGYLETVPPNPIVMLAHEVGFSNKYDEPMVVQLPPEVAEDVALFRDETARRRQAQEWLNGLPQTEERPMEWSMGLPGEWPVVRVRVEPAYWTVAMVLAVIVLGFLMAVAVFMWARTVGSWRFWA